MTVDVIPGAHWQACADRTCTGCYPDPRVVATSGSSDGLSETQRLTQRRQMLLVSGVHPATRQPLLCGASETCGDCAHAVLTHGGNRSHCKCDLTNITAGAATDIRKSWPACRRYERCAS